MIPLKLCLPGRGNVYYINTVQVAILCARYACVCAPACVCVCGVCVHVVCVCVPVFVCVCVCVVWLECVGGLCRCGSASLWEGVDVSMTLCVGVGWVWLHLHK